MSKNKLRKFNDLLTHPNVYQCFDWHNPALHGKGKKRAELKGHWSERHFGNDQALTLELACGGGEYTVGLAEMHPDRNFVGVDVKGARIWKGSSRALEKGLGNAAFLRCRIEQIYEFFGEGEVDSIWITFPDPFVRDSKSNRRLTSPYFLGHYRKILKPGGIIHLKTDSESLYDFTLATIASELDCKLIYAADDIYAKSPLPLPELAFKTYYERMHLAERKTIKFVKFSLG